MSEDPELWGRKTKDNESKEINYKTEKHDYEKFLYSLKIDSEISYKTKLKNLNKKKLSQIASKILIGTVELVVGSGLIASELAPVGIMCASSNTLLSSISSLITHECFSKLKTRCTKIQFWIIVITSLYVKILKQSMVDKRIDEKEALDLKKIYILHLDKRKEMMKSTRSKV